MILEKQPPSLTESGVRRIGRSMGRWFWDNFIPMAPRNKEADKTVMAWRGAVTAALAAILALLSKLVSGPGGSEIQQSIDRLGVRIEIVETKVDSLGRRVDTLQGAVDGALRGMRL